MFKLYIASDIFYAKRWIQTREILKADNIEVNSRWIDLLKDGEPQDFTLKQIRESWHKNLADIIDCDAFLLVKEKDTDRARGSLFEAGFAYAMGKPVIYVGDPLSLGSLHSCFRCFKTLGEAVADIIEFVKEKGYEGMKPQ